MIEDVLVYELSKIDGLKGSIYPMNAPKNKQVPYIVYQTEDTPSRELDGYIEDAECVVLINIFHSNNKKMKELRKLIRNAIRSWEFRTVGKDLIYIKEVKIQKVTEQFEHELALHRGIIPFTIYYEE